MKLNISQLHVNRSLAKFDPDEPCAKCGWLGKDVKVVGDCSWRVETPEKTIYSRCEAELCVSCSRCGYAWIRLPLDFEETRQEAARQGYEIVG